MKRRLQRTAPLFGILLALGLLAPGWLLKGIAVAVLLIALVVEVLSLWLSRGSASDAEEAEAEEMIALDELIASLKKVVERGEIDMASWAPECSGLDISPEVFTKFLGWLVTDGLPPQAAMYEGLGMLVGLQVAKDRPVPVEVEVSE